MGREGAVEVELLTRCGLWSVALRRVVFDFSRFLDVKRDEAKVETWCTLGW